MTSKNSGSGAVACVLVLASVLGVMGAGTGAAKELMIVGHPGLNLESIDQKELQRIYLGKLTLWPDDTTIVPVMLKSGSVHDDFIEEYLDRSVQRFATYWRQMVFTGKGVPPRSFPNEEELLDFVSRTPGSVGFASATTDMTQVKILSLD